jgi:ABC-2 type transport system permease protein
MQHGTLMTNMPTPPGVRAIGPVNWLGLWTLYSKEVQRFISVWGQTIGAPVMTTLLFLAIFSLALGRAVKTVGGVAFMEYLAPGLIMMAIIQNAFANTSSSIIGAKMQGSYVDVMMAPLTPSELTLGYALGGVTRGILVAIAVAAAMAVFVPLKLSSPAYLLFFGLSASLMLSLLGMIAGIWAVKHDHISLVTNFIITPCAFLSGTFYSIDRLPGMWNTLARLDPFFYMIDGFRYAFIGHADGSLTTGIMVMIGGNIVLWVAVHMMIASGYRVKP